MERENIMKQTKTWNELEEALLQVEAMICIPSDITKVREGHIFDEDKSVKWNREQVILNNEKYRTAVEELNYFKNKQRNAVYEDIVEATRNLFTTDITFYDTMEELENKLDEFKNRGRLYKLFQERIFNAYNKTYNAKIINNRFGNKGLA